MPRLAEASHGWGAWSCSCSCSLLDEDSGAGGGGTDGEEPCDPIPPAGMWAGVEDWNDVGPMGDTDELDSACGIADNLHAHHCFLTSVHAVHLHTGSNPGPNGEGSLFMMHGQGDERLWPIGTTPDAMTWHPATPQATWGALRLQGQMCGGAPCCAPGELFCFEEVTGWPDIFCSGHVQLADGTLLTAGGNVTGGPSGGGLEAMFRFIPEEAFTPTPPIGGCGFGWQIDGANQNPLPEMEHDRWYPTLTLLGDGRVLIAGGTSRDFADEMDPEGRARQPPILEIFNPMPDPVGTTPALTVEPLDAAHGHPGAVFPRQDGNPVGVPNYPFMFVLPNADVFYAGSENASALPQNGFTAHGRILILDTNSTSGNFEWAEDPTTPGTPFRIESSIPGGSAVMYRPGKIMKSGGGNTPASTYETVDLSDLPAGDYSSAPTSFTTVSDPPPDGPLGAEVSSPVALPMIPSPSGQVPGFYAFADYDVVHDPKAPAPYEITSVIDACESVCEAHFADQPGVTTTCDASSGFATPVESGFADAPHDLLRNTERHGEGIFGAQVVSCALGVD